MAFAKKNPTIAGQTPVPTVDDACVAAPKFSQDCLAADSALNNVGVIGILPAGYVPCLPMLVQTPGLGGTGAISIGILDEATGDISVKAADGGAAWAAAVSVGSAAATQVAPTAAYLGVQKSNADRKIAVKFTTAGGTAGALNLTVPYRSA